MPSPPSSMPSRIPAPSPPFLASPSHPSGQSNSKRSRERFGDHKENSPAVSRPVHNSRTPPSKKPWNQHFSKNTNAANRILGERNASGSPLRSPSGAKLGADKIAVSAANEKKSPASPFTASAIVSLEKESLIPTPKGVANLSKRIQQFLEDQETVLASTSPCRSGPVIQPSLSNSPYDPYNSPFSERPQFLRLHGTVPSPESSELLVAQIPQIHIQQNTFSTHADVSGDTDVEEGEIVGEESMPHLLCDTGEAERLKDAPAQLLHVGTEASCSGEGTVPQQTQEFPEEQMEVGGDEKIPEACFASKNLSDVVEIEHTEAGPIASNQSVDEAEIELPENCETKKDFDGSQITENEGFCSEEACHGTEDISETCDQLYAEDEFEEGPNYGSEFLRGALAFFLLATVVLACGGPGLLPEFLKDNHLSSAWHSSRYYEPMQVFLRNMQGLWNQEQMSFSVDVSVAVKDGMTLYKCMTDMTDHASQHIQMQIQETSRSISDWWMSVVQNVPPQRDIYVKDLVDKDRHDQDEQNDLLWSSDEFQGNVSLMGEEPTVEPTVEEILRMKGGTTEMDRLEVLEHFWEYTRFSASVEGYLKGQNEAETYADIESDGAQDLHLEADEEETNGASRVSVDAERDAPSRSEEAVSNTPDDTEASAAKMEEAGALTITDKGEESAELHVSAFVPHVEEKDMEIVHDTEETDEGIEPVEDNPAVDGKGLTLVSMEGVETVAVEESPAVNDITVSSVEGDSAEKWDASKSRLVVIVLGSSAIAIVVAVGSVGAAGLVSSRRGASKIKEGATKTVARAPPPSANVEFLKKETKANEGEKQNKQRERKAVADRESGEGMWRESGDEVMSALGRRREAAAATMIEDLNGRFASLLQSPEVPAMARTDEDLAVVRSPLPVSTVQSPYGSFTAYKVVPRKEGEAMEAKVTPVRRSSRIRNQVVAAASPEIGKGGSGGRRIAISPP